MTPFYKTDACLKMINFVKEHLMRYEVENIREITLK